MHLPIDLREKIDEIALRIPRAALVRAAASLSAHYRDRQPTNRLPLAAEDLVAAYLVTRFPATYAAAYRVLSECLPRLTTPPVSMIDLGAGCGAATLAAQSLFPTITSAQLIETNKAMIGAGKELLLQATWRNASLGETAIPAAGLIIASYALGELNPDIRDTVVDRAWKAAQVLVIIEAGSTEGFRTVLALRDRLLAKGAHMIAPCPHTGPCPMPNTDWCHFAARLERSSLHRQLKQGTLSYEDEKFSYVALSKTPAPTAPTRIIRRPTHNPGLVELTLCRGSAIETHHVRKRDKEKFRAARHASWGEPWD